MTDNETPKIIRKAEIEVPSDKDGKAFKLTLEGDKVKILAPTLSWNPRADIGALKRAVDELCAVAKGQSGVGG